MFEISENLEAIKELTKMGGFVGLAQINPIAGNLEYNSEKIINYIKQAEEIGLDLIIFPEYALMGCSMKDFVKRYPFITEEENVYLEKIAQNTTKTTAIIGYVNSENKSVYAIIRWGKVDQTIKKCEYFTSKLLNDGVEYYIRINSIPSRTYTEEIRHKYLKEVSRETKRPIIEVNQVGSIDNDSYAGLSCAYDENGNLFARAKDFEEQLLVINPFRKMGKIYKTLEQTPPKTFSLDYDWDLERIYKSIVQSIRDYFQKCGLKRAVLGLSGGLDSTVCAVLLVDALGKENVFGVSMPSKLTSNESKSDAKQLAENLGIGFCEQSIKPMFETTNDCLDELFSKVQKSWSCKYKESFTQDNIQARARAMFLWGISNEFENCIPIATSDKSEIYMGYATINGDMSGGYAPIADVTKTKLFALARWLNKNRAEKNAIPESIILKKPGAELAIDPNTGKTLCAEDALMPYEFLDEIIWRIENHQESYKELLNSEFIYEKKMNISKKQKEEWLDKFFKRMSTSIYKWSILPPSVIIDSNTVNKTIYSQPITSGKIKYKNTNELY